MRPNASRGDNGASSSSGAITVPVEASQARAWDKWALASERGMGAGPALKRRLVRGQPSKEPTLARP